MTVRFYYDASGRPLGAHDFAEDGLEGEALEAALAFNPFPNAAGFTDQRPPSAASRWDGAEWQPDLELARSAAHLRITRLADQAGALAVAGISPAERDSWAAKEAAARRVIDGEGGEADREMLEIEAGMTGETIEGLAASIVGSAARWRFMAAHLAGARRRGLADVAAAQSIEDLEAAELEARAAFATLPI